MQQPTPNNSSRVLVAQDPYAMTPQDRSRYESLFPQYAKPDGFVYGKEAVELFLKSGINQAVLKEIWQMVDRPVDNRLDKLEFAISMHLIVCISKKNLPPPQGALPNSLRALKAGSAEPATPSLPPRHPVQQQQTQQAPPQIPSPPPPAHQGMNSIPSPTQQRRTFSVGEQSPVQQYRQMAAVPQPQSPMRPNPPFAQQQVQSFPQVPPEVATSGMSISDAFEGLSTTSGDVHQSSLPAYVPDTPKHVYAFSAVPEEESPYAAPAPAPAPVRVAPPAPSTKSLASSYDMGTAHEELGKLQKVLQKLQAENISLKAQMGSMSEEEKDVQRELGATVAEVGKLSSELQTLRAQVLASKTRLLEASADLRAAREKKG
jgi:hypothetical protein